MKTHDDRNLRQVLERIDEAIMYTVPGGKMFRAMMTIKTFKNMVNKNNLNEHQLKQCYACGWFIEIMQAACLIYDDMMDNSVTRRGKPCWHLRENNQIGAVNDASSMRLISFKLISKYCSHHHCYLHMVDVVSTVMNATMFGQVIDGLTTVEGKRPDFSLLNETRYDTIVKYKTSYYTFVLPVRIGLYLANITDETIHVDAEKLLLRIGHLFQVQDDFLDIYGDPNITGKIGTDIADGKCNWIAVQAYKQLHGKDKKLFVDNYGTKHGVYAIKMLFDKVNVEMLYRKYEEKEFHEIKKLIDTLRQRHRVNVDTFNEILKMMYKRKK